MLIWINMIKKKESHAVLFFLQVDGIKWSFLDFIFSRKSRFKFIFNIQNRPDESHLSGSVRNIRLNPRLRNTDLRPKSPGSFNYCIVPLCKRRCCRVRRNPWLWLAWRARWPPLRWWAEDDARRPCGRPAWGPSADAWGRWRAWRRLPASRALSLESSRSPDFQIPSLPKRLRGAGQSAIISI